jgi:hypothetical protein
LSWLSQAPEGSPPQLPNSGQSGPFAHDESSAPMSNAEAKRQQFPKFILRFDVMACLLQEKDHGQLGP